MPPKRGTPPRSIAGAAHRAALEAQSLRLQLLAASPQPEPEPEPEPEPDAELQPTWSALGRLLQDGDEGGGGREGGGTADRPWSASSDDDDELDATPRGRSLLAIEDVELRPSTNGGAVDEATTRYRCLWQMDGVVLSYRQRTWETLDDLWGRGEAAQQLLRQFERAHPGSTQLPPEEHSDDGDSASEDPDVAGLGGEQPPSGAAAEPATPTRGGGDAAEPATPTREGSDGRAASPGVGWYRVRSRAAVTADRTIRDISEVEIVHEFPAGSRVWVEEVATDEASGKLRCRTGEGWVSLVANSGVVLLVRCDSSADNPAEDGEWM